MKAGMTVDAITFASKIDDEILDHQLSDEYAAAILAMERGEPQARARVLNACAQVLAQSARHERPTRSD